MQVVKSVFSLALISIGLGVIAVSSNSSLMGALTVAMVVFLGARLTYSVMGLLQTHNLYFGRVGPLQPKNLLAFGGSKQGTVIIYRPGSAVGHRRFPMDRSTYDLLKSNEGIIVESLRWTNLPVAIYRGFRK